MSDTTRAYALTIAGFDPSAGAGLLADTKTMEQHRVYALNVCTALTVQNDITFEQVVWQSETLILQQLELLLLRFAPKVCKIGLIENWQVLEAVLDRLHTFDKDIQIVLDPIFRASAGFTFHTDTDWKQLEKVLRKITLLTPNLLEVQAMSGNKPQEETLTKIATYCAVLLKGGHATTNKGTDYLYDQNQVIALVPPQLARYEKHGSGCVLSAAIVANLAKGLPLQQSCEAAKIYMANFLNSNPTLLGYHRE